MEGFRRTLGEHGAVPEDGGGGLTGLRERTDVRSPDVLGGFVRVFDAIDRVLVSACALATIAAGLVLTYSIAVRYVLHSSTDWQDEMAVFLLVGATFLSAPYVQAMRGHIAIEAIEGFLPQRLERLREILSDIICCSAASSPGSRGCCCSKPSTMEGSPIPPGRRRFGFPIR
jgi:hypothetical protein